VYPSRFPSEDNLSLVPMVLRTPMNLSAVQSHNIQRYVGVNAMTGKQCLLGVGEEGGHV